MKIVKPEAHIIKREDFSPCAFVEKIGRTCYKSEDKITEDSAPKFTIGLSRRKHYAILEHFWVYFRSDRIREDSVIKTLCENVECETGKNLHSFIKEFFIEDYVFTACPIRVIIELVDYFGISKATPVLLKGLIVSYPEFFGVSDDIVKMLSGELAKQEFNHIIYANCDGFIEGIANLNINYLTVYTRNIIQKASRTHTIHFVCDRGVSHELVRHRLCSFAQESTRYCTYSNEKFGGEISVIEPPFDNSLSKKLWVKSCEQAEEAYVSLITNGTKAEIARGVLPNSLKTEIIVTANEIEWEHILNLRYFGTTGTPHPQIKELMGLIADDLIKASDGRIKEVCNE